MVRSILFIGSLIFAFSSVFAFSPLAKLGLGTFSKRSVVRSSGFGAAIGAAVSGYMAAKSGDMNLAGPAMLTSVFACWAGTFAYCRTPEVKFREAVDELQGMDGVLLRIASQKNPKRVLTDIEAAYSWCQCPREDAVHDLAQSYVDAFRLAERFKEVSNHPYSGGLKEIAEERSRALDLGGKNILRAIACLRRG